MSSVVILRSNVLPVCTYIYSAVITEIELASTPFYSSNQRLSHKARIWHRASR